MNEGEKILQDGLARPAPAPPRTTHRVVARVTTPPSDRGSPALPRHDITPSPRGTR